MRRKYICKTTLDFGKVDYLGNGRRNCRATVDLELYENETGLPCFSASGRIYNPRGTDIYCGGQCLDEIAKYIHTPKMREALRLWEAYHLNDMHPECEHQRALGWPDEAREEVVLYHYRLRPAFSSEKMRIENEALATIREGNAFAPTPEQTNLLALAHFLDTYDPVSGELAEYYELNATGIHGACETKTRGWVRYEDAPDVGILGKPCPVCGYRYGHGWRHMPIPTEDIEAIKRLCGQEA